MRLLSFVSTTNAPTVLLLVTLAGASLLPGCTISAYYNAPLSEDTLPTRASFRVQDTIGNDDVLVALAISGGGSRSAYFASMAMFRLQDVYAELDLLKEVDVISCVSGGSLTGAYYCISQDWAGTPMRSNRVWQKSTVKEIMSRNFQARWLGNCFLPTNLLRYWFTSYDRSDIMAQTFEDNLYDTRPMGLALTFADLNPERPCLIINATDATENLPEEEHFGKVFTFTEEHFREKLNSDLSSYPVARAVMASCAFPGAFNYMTLRDFRDSHGEEERYIHLIDGGTSDNLGLESIKRVIIEAMWRGRPYRHFVVILVDAYVEGQGVDRTDYDPYSPIQNVLDAFESLMKFRRNDLLGQFKTGIFDVDENRKLPIENLIFWHINFKDVDPNLKDHEGENLQQMLNRIPSRFSISDDEKRRLEKAVDHLIYKGHPKLDRIIGTIIK